jgi:hypothetical protein
MPSLFTRNRMKTVVLSSLLAAMVSFSAHAGIYPFSWNDTGPIPQGGPTFSVEHTISTVPSDLTISSIELFLTFNDSTSLTGDGTGIQGLLTLGTDVSSPFVGFYPVGTSIQGAQRVYDVVFSGASGSPGAGFNGLDPDDTWGLVLWDNATSAFQNGLVGWELDITAVPEPVNVALAVFGVCLAGAGAGRWALRRARA